MAPENTVHVRIRDSKDVAASRRKGMQMALEMGFLPADATKVAVVISELARNIISYAGEGTITIIGREEENGTRYIKVIADDKGPGIPDVEQALFDGFTTSGGLGLGLSGSKRLMDEFSVFSEVGKGTTVTAVKWLR